MWTVIVGFFFACLFPGIPSRPVTLIGLRYFSDREAFILHQRIVQEDSQKHALTNKIQPKVVYKAVGVFAYTSGNEAKSSMLAGERQVVAARIDYIMWCGCRVLLCCIWA